MERFKNALKSVNKIGLMALVLVAFATMAFTPSKNLAMKKWSYDPTAPAGHRWADITGQQQSDEENTRDYLCNGAEQICTAEFDESIDPDVTPSTPLNVVEGQFVPEN
ncbi:hypothetical protein [Pedobacter nototheniae]|uniref:hypothetical protein n=1 Tax=Pedobacter nototheniae TaxID=2488994 RepID=UPI0029304A64|nr:hypothetical protein [Pedobacter nototheniae]